MVLSEFQNYDTKILGVSIILSNSCIHIYIYIYIVIHRQTVSLYHNSSVWLDT